MKSTQKQLVLGYARVSTVMQAEEGHSLDNQEQKLRTVATTKGHTIDEMIVERGKSGGNLNRPEIKKLLQLVKAGQVEAVYITKIDRIARNAFDLLSLINTFDKHDTRLIIADLDVDTKSPMGRFAVTMIGAMAEWERDTIKERIQDNARYLRQNKMPYGQTPFGYRVEGRELDAEGKLVKPGKLVEDPERIAVLNAIKLDRASGMSYNKIAKKLNEQGIKPSRSDKWYAQTVSDVLASLIVQETAA